MKPLQKMSDEEMRDLGLTGDWWKNDLYRVRVVKSEPWNGRSMIRLSIKRHDGKPIDPAWRDKQAIKNQLIGKECEGIELYPAESREQNQSHQYHLWVVDDTKFRFTDWFGWNAERITASTNAEIEKGELVDEEE